MHFLSIFENFQVFETLLKLLERGARLISCGQLPVILTMCSDTCVKKMYIIHCAKSVRIRSFSGLHFPAFGLNTEIYSVNLRIQSKCRKVWIRKTPNTDTFWAVIVLVLLL